MYPIDLLEKLDKISPEEVVGDAIEETKKDLVKIQTDQQMHGLNAAGGKIGTYKNKRYSQKKHQMNPLPGLGVPDLRLTGAQHDQTFALVGDVSTTLGSNVPYARYNEDRYKDSFGLNEKYLSLYRGVLQNPLVKRLSQLTGLRFV